MRRRDAHAFKTDRREDCVQMPGKTARSAARQPFGLPKVTAVIRVVGLSCQNVGKTQKSMPFESHPGNTGSKELDRFI